MKESEINYENSTVTCSICHRKNINIKQNHSKLKKLFNKNLKYTELSEIIKKCKCENIKNFGGVEDNESNKNYEIYTHKYCIIVKILFNFELKCEKCNTLYNIKITKEIDQKKKILLFASFTIVYIIHIFIYLFCLFLLFINVILKGYVIIIYKHLSIFFAIILLILNSIFLSFSIKESKKRFRHIYEYSLNIFDINNKYNNNCCIDKENEFYNLIYEFYQYFYNNPMKYLITNINKKFINNKINYLYNKSIRDFIIKNNLDIITINQIIKKNSMLKIQEKPNKNQGDSKEIILNNNTNLNILKLNSKNILIDSEIISGKSNGSKNISNLNNNSSKNNCLINKSSKDENFNLNHKDYINININPVASNNININIRFSADKTSIIDHSSIKEKTFQTNKLFKKKGKSALIPTNLLMSKIISKINTFKRQKRILKSIKIKENKLRLKGENITGNIEENEEVDFSEFDKMESKISKNTKDNDFFSSKRNNLRLKYYNLKSKNSFNDVDLNISNSDVEGQEDLVNQNFRGSMKSSKNISGKHVHFENSNTNNINIKEN